VTAPAGGPGGGTLPELCLRRPIATLTVVLGALVLGLVSLQRLPLEYLPEIQGRSLTVSVSYPGSSPREVERTIVRPLEEELASLEGLEELRATATATGATLRMELDTDIDTDDASIEVRERIDRARARLPANLGRVEVRRWRSTDMPIVRARVAPRPDVTGRRLERFVDDVLVPRLTRVEGVGNVEVRGLARAQVLVELHRERLARFGLTPGDVAATLRLRNRNASAGLLRSGGRVLSVRVLGELGDAGAVAALPLGDDLLVSDVADVREETPPLDRVERLDGASAITIRISKESGANTIAACERVREELDAVLAGPAARGFAIEVYSDQSERIALRLLNLELSGLYGGLLLCGVLLLFLRDLRSTLIVAATIPLSIVLTFAIIYVGRLAGSAITLNVVSIMGLILGIGLVVDTGIVVLENIVRLREAGLPAAEAAARGAAEVSRAVTAAMVTSLIVFVPLLFTDSMGSRWMSDLGWVVCASVFSSLWVALSVVPLLAAALLRRPPRRITARPGEPDPPGRAGPGRIAGAYERLLRLTLRWPVVLLVVLPLCGWQIHDFFTNVERSWGGGEANREVDLEVEVPRSFDAAEREALFSRLERLILERRDELDLESLTTSFARTAESDGGGRRRRRGGGDDELELVLREDGPGERLSVGDVRERLRELLPDVPGVRFQLGASRRMGGGRGRGVEIHVSGRSSGELLGPARRVAGVLRSLPGVEEVQISDEAAAGGLEVRPDGERAARFDLSRADVGRAVAATLGERVVTRLRGADRELEVLLRLAEADRADRRDLERTPVPREGASGPARAVEVGAVADVAAVPEARQIVREDRQAVVTVTANVLEGAEVRTVTERAEVALAALTLPRGTSWELSSRLRRWREGEEESTGAIVLAFALVLILLCALFESYAQPLVIATTVPFALVGVAWAFLATDTKLDDMAKIGVMILIGIVVNHGIVFVDRYNQLAAEGLVRVEALVGAGRDRLRPIVMTAATTVLGLLPIVLQHLFPETSSDSGAQVYGPIGLAVASGLVVSTALTLLVLPALLHVGLGARDWVWARIGWRGPEAPPPAAAPEEPPK